MPPPPPAYTGGDNVYGQPQQSQYAGAQLASWGRRVGGVRVPTDSRSSIPPANAA
jgi:hypothetical protein